MIKQSPFSILFVNFRQLAHFFVNIKVIFYLTSQNISVKLYDNSKAEVIISGNLSENIGRSGGDPGEFTRSDDM